MCRQLILLAKNEHRQMTFTCEHGTMHLTHQHATLCLGRADFIRFAQWVTEGNLFALNQSGAWQVRESEDGQVELWLGSGGIRMTVIEFFAFTDLLRDTLQRLEKLRLDEILSGNPSSLLQSSRVNPSLN
jgi:hypothetical protein